LGTQFQEEIDYNVISPAGKNNTTTSVKLPTIIPLPKRVQFTCKCYHQLLATIVAIYTRALSCCMRTELSNQMGALQYIVY